MLKLLDILFFWLHIVIILFNLFGWLWKKARKMHLGVALITLFSWLFLGIWFGLGYCFLTDWHWEVKYELGETDLPSSFVKYFFDEYTMLNIKTDVIDWITGVSFGLALILSIYLNIKTWRK